MITMDIERDAGKSDSFEPQQLPLEKWDDARMMAALLEQDDLYRRLDDINGERRAALEEYKADRQDLRDELGALQEQIRAQRAAR